MAELIKVFHDKSFIKFDKGKFDNWCVYIYQQGIGLHAPRDIDYLIFFRDAAMKLSQNIVYNDFLEIYSNTTNQINNSVLTLIENIANKYIDKSGAEKWLIVIYAGMIAEENKANSKLKKRIKRLAMHQLLVENIDPLIVANFSKGKKWRELDKECCIRGF